MRWCHIWQDGIANVKGSKGLEAPKGRNSTLDRDIEQLAAQQNSIKKKNKMQKCILGWQ